MSIHPTNSRLEKLMKQQAPAAEEEPPPSPEPAAEIIEAPTAMPAGD